MGKNENNKIITPAPSNNGESLPTLENKKCCSWIWKYGGLILAGLSSFLFSLSTIIVKMLHQNYKFRSHGSSFYRYFGIAVQSVPLLILCEYRYRRSDSQSNESIFEHIWPINLRSIDDKWINAFGLVFRGIFSSIAVILRYYSLEYLTVADASIIAYSNPVLVMILAHFFLDEKFGIISFITVILTLTGLIFIARPPLLSGMNEFNQTNLIGVSLGLLSMCVSSILYIVTRKIRQVHFSIFIFSIGFIGLITACVFCTIFNDFKFPTELKDSLLVLGLAEFSFFGQILIISAIKLEQAGPVSLIRTCDILFGFILQFLVLGIVPEIFSIIGGAIVLISVLLIGVRKAINILPDDHPKKKLFWFMLK